MEKTHIYLSDGTLANVNYYPITNVGLMYEHLPSTPYQRIKYDPGVGGENGGIWADPIEHGIDALFGWGINQNIMTLYQDICEHYREDDKICLFGFSRGAYTVRSLIGLIRKAGILKNPDESLIQQAFDLYKKRDDTPDTTEALEFRKRHARFVEMKDRKIIHLLGAYDTVGGLGFPVPIIGRVDPPKFHDTQLSSIVAHAYHAIAVDEMRSDYNVNKWTPKPGVISQQRWFIGNHSDVGGGHFDNRAFPTLADRPFEWMYHKASEHGVVFEPKLPENWRPDSYKKPVHDGGFTLTFPHPRVMGEKDDEMIDHTVERRYQEDPEYQPSNLVAYLEKQAQELEETEAQEQGCCRLV